MPSFPGTADLMDASKDHGFHLIKKITVQAKCRQWQKSDAIGAITLLNRCNQNI